MICYDSVVAVKLSKMEEISNRVVEMVQQGMTLSQICETLAEFNQSHVYKAYYMALAAQHATLQQELAAQAQDIVSGALMRSFLENITSTDPRRLQLAIKAGAVIAGKAKASAKSTLVPVLTENYKPAALLASEEAMKPVTIKEKTQHEADRIKALKARVTDAKTQKAGVLN